MGFMASPKNYRFEPDGFAARIALAVLASAGIIYVNLAPVIVTGLAQSPEISSRTAGYVFSANMFGTAIGGLVITFLITHLEWRRTAIPLLGLLIGVDIMAVFVDNLSALTAIRFLHGLVGGALIGVGFSVISRIRNPEVTYSLLIFIQLSLGGLGIAVLTPFIPSMGMGIVWLSLAGFSIVTMLLIPFLDDYAFVKQADDDGDGGRAPWRVIILTLLALFLFQAGEMAAFAYVIEIGIGYAFEPEIVNMSVAVSLWIGAPAALLVAWWSLRSGRMRPICIGTSLIMASISLLLIDDSLAFLFANIGFGIFFSLTIPYLLGISSELDNKGQIAAFAGFTSSLGLATGPAVAAFILQSGQLTQVVQFSIVLLIASILLILVPARILDQRMKRGETQW